MFKTRKKHLFKNFQPSKLQSLDNTSRGNNGYSDQFKKNGLVIHVKSNRSVEIATDGQSNDGVLLNVRPIIVPFSNPTAILFGMDAIITLSIPRHVAERSECWPNNNLISLRFFDYYDQDGYACVENTFQETTASILQCFMPMYSMNNQNMTTCNLALMLGLKDFVTRFTDLNLSMDQESVARFFCVVDQLR